MEGPECGRNDAEMEMVTVHCVNVPPSEGIVQQAKHAVKETLFPDDPFRQFKNQPRSRKCVLGLQYVFPILQWAPKYSLNWLKSDVLSGITIATLAIPQGISYAKLANLPPVMGLYASFVPPLIYAMLGSSKDLAVGTIAVVSLLLGSVIGDEVSPTENSELYITLAITATFFAGVFQAALGIFRLGFIIDLLSHATIEGYMTGSAIIVSLQQLKGILGLEKFTQETDIISVITSASKQVHEWRWESIILGLGALIFLFTARYISKRWKRLFWVSAAAPLASVILGSLLVFATRADKHGVQIVGTLKKGINPLSVGKLVFHGEYLGTSLKAGLIMGLISLAEGLAVGRTFALFKNYQIDGNKEMVAIGIMNVVGSCTSCYVSTGAFSRTAVNFNAGCKTAASNIVMAIAIMFTLLFLTPLFHYTPNAVLSAIIASAMLGLIDIHSPIHLWKLDKIDFFVFLGGLLGVVFGTVEIGLIIAVSISLVRLLMHAMRPHTAVLGNIPGTCVYRNREQYPDATRVPGILILRIDSPILFANSSYLQERIIRWIEDEKENPDQTLQYVILDMGPVTSIDTSGISALEELKKKLDLRMLQLVMANPGRQTIEKLNNSKFIEILGKEWLFLTVDEAVVTCKTLFHRVVLDNADQVTH